MKLLLHTAKDLPSLEEQEALSREVMNLLARSETVRLNQYKPDKTDLTHLFSSPDHEAGVKPANKNALQLIFNEKDYQDPKAAATIGLEVMAAFAKLKLELDLEVETPDVTMVYSNYDLNMTQVVHSNNRVSVWSAANEMVRHAQVKND